MVIFFLLTTPTGSDGGPLVAAANPADPRQKSSAKEDLRSPVM